MKPFRAPACDADTEAEIGAVHGSSGRPFVGAMSKREHVKVLRELNRRVRDAVDDCEALLSRSKGVLTTATRDTDSKQC